MPEIAQWCMPVGPNPRCVYHGGMIRTPGNFRARCRSAAAGMDRINRLAGDGREFIFIIDAWAGSWYVEEPQKAGSDGVLWDMEGRGNLGPAQSPPAGFRFRAVIPERRRYERGFSVLRRGQIAGETYLANLTYPSVLDTDLDLATLARCARARFRIHVPGTFTAFSPERFVRISPAGRISSFPMKGTIDASLPEARETVLADEKETAEHVTIVDLIRNDLGRVAVDVEVPRYRFITEVAGRGRRLLQVSSEVCGRLEGEWRSRLGDILAALLPAGSVTGAPKKRTCELIREAEGYKRNWYTGVFGHFDGSRLDSAVTIRYAESDGEGTLVYKSGGGITIYSDMDAEYAELENKIYAPFG